MTNKAMKVGKEQEALLDALIAGCEGPQDILGEHGLLKALQKRLMERALNAELTHHLGYECNARSDTPNSRNGTSSKTVNTGNGVVHIDVPRDRHGEFEPQLVKKHQRRLEGFDEHVIGLYARGLSTRDIQSQLEELYGVEVSPTLISNVTGAVLEDVRAWQGRALDAVYPIVYFDALFVKSRQDGPVKNKAVYLALGINMDGEKELLGLWIADTEGAKFWLHVLNELHSRGLQDCLIACVDGLKGLPEAIETVFPKTQVQLCIVHQVRNSLHYVNWKQRRRVAGDLRAIYGAPTLDEAEQALERFEQAWDGTFPAISRSWRANWPRLTPMFDYPPAIRKVLYTTNAIESLNSSLRKVLKKRGAFPNDESILKVLYLALQRISKKWTMPISNWKSALNQFAIMFEDRLPL